MTEPLIKRNSPWIWLVAFFATALLLVNFLFSSQNPALTSRFLSVAPRPAILNTPQMSTETIAIYPDGIAHSPTVIAYDDGTIQAIWFRGSREAASDVGLDQSHFSGGLWSSPERLLDADSEKAERGEYIKTIGNPVLFRHPSGEIWLAYVTPVLGGWSTSRISLRRTTDHGKRWSAARFLTLSPFLGISNLVRHPALPMESGYVGLPVYHELIEHYTEIAVIDPEGNVLDKRRIGEFGAGIQADLLAGKAGNLVTYLRPTGSQKRRLLFSRTTDGGLNWTEPAATKWANPGAPACSENFPDGSSVLVFNEAESGRTNLTFYFRPDSDSEWGRLTYGIRSTKERESISYCSMSLDQKGYVHMVYSRFSDRSIQHIAFNRTWAESQVDEVGVMP